MDRTRYVLAVIAALVGLVWALQGIGAPIGRSFMIGDPFWLLAGVALVAGGARLRGVAEVAAPLNERRDRG